jgi:hypothetical protein
MLTPTETQLNLARFVAYYLSTIPGTIVCGMVLIAYAVVAKFPESRTFLDRVSFRLLVYSLISNVLYGVAFATSPITPGWSCDLNAFLVNLTLFFATFFTTCIAINLQLVLVHELDGTSFEKYYVAGSSLLSLALTIVPYASQQFGWDTDSSTCWYKNPNDVLRLRWIIGTQSFWVALAAAIETVSSIAVLVWLFRSRKRIGRLSNTASFSGSFSDPDAVVCDVDAGRLENTRSDLVKRHAKYRKIILRIALYPMVSLVLNISNVILDLRISVVGSSASVDFQFVLLDLVLYGLRTLVYGLIAAMDPAFVNALRHLKAPRRSEKPFHVRLPRCPHPEAGTYIEMRRPSGSIASISSDTDMDIPRKLDMCPNEPVTQVAERDSVDSMDLEPFRQFERQL